MLTGTDIERATVEEEDGDSFRGENGSFSWSIARSWGRGMHYKISLAHKNVRGSVTTIATRALWQNAAGIIADYINKQEMEAK